MERRFENCTDGITRLTQSGKAVILKQSGFYETEPVDYTDQDWFVNGVVKIETSLNPSELLKMLKTVEKEIGRTQTIIRYGPRILDMDIIFYDDLVLNSPQLTIPHPRMHKRRFVLCPICDIAPDMIHPVLHYNMRSLLDKLEDCGQKVVPR
jgi:2-amino-4-hydroxy-6-hydroxymethyldihydropteridine diphosphokinase